MTDSREEREGREEEKDLPHTKTRRHEEIVFAAKPLRDLPHRVRREAGTRQKACVRHSIFAFFAFFA
jgi:hypothetical protein